MIIDQVVRFIMDRDADGGVPVTKKFIKAERTASLAK